MGEEKIRKWVYIIALILGGGVVLYLFFRYLFSALLPFLIAWAIAFAVRPLAVRVRRRVKLPERVISAVLAALISVAAIGAVSFAVWAIGSELWRLLAGLGDGSPLRKIIDGITGSGLLGDIFDSFGDRLADIFYELILSLATSLGGIVTAWLAAVPKIFLFILITVIASVYFALDLERVNRAVKRFLPSGIFSRLAGLRRGAFNVGIRYMRSYLFLMLITFIVMLGGLLLLGRPYALLLSFVIAALDVLPVLGVGTVLVPWSVYELFFGERGVGVGLIVLFLLYQLIRQLAEPRIIGRELGVHPLLSLLLLYVGYAVFGIVGILFVPLFVILINAFDKPDATEVDQLAAPEHNGS